MDFSVWLLYAAVALINVLSPGPAILLAVSNSMAYGVRSVVFSSLGNVAGLFLLSSAAMIGLGAILKTSSVLFTVVKITGAGYLIYLGIRQWRSGTNVFAQATPRPADGCPCRRHIFARAFLVAATNPKPILFFTALFPQFVTPEQPLLPQFLILTGTFMGFSFGSLMAYAALGRSAKRWFTNERRVSWFNRMTGGAFVLLGVGVLRLKHSPA